MHLKVDCTPDKVGTECRRVRVLHTAVMEVCDSSGVSDRDAKTNVGLEILVKYSSGWKDRG